MPIHDLGYRSWEGEYEPRGWRWLVFTRVGIGLAMRSRWLKRLVVIAFLQSIFAIASLYALELAMARVFAGRPGQRAQTIPLVLASMQQGMALGLWSQDDVTDIAKSLSSDDPKAEQTARYQIWRIWMLGMIRSPQALLMVIMLGILTPSLISFDIRSRAFLLYFSRPITPYEYVFGKTLVVWAFILAITAGPGLVTYVASLFLSPSLGSVLYTWDLPIRIVIASLCVAIPTTALALCLSASTTESRRAGFAWFSLWAISMTSYLVLTRVTARATPGISESEAANQWVFLSLFHTLGDVEKLIFGVGRPFSDVMGSLAILTLLTVGCYWIILRRVMAPMRV